MKPILFLIDLQNDFLSTPSLEPAAGELIDRAVFLLKKCRSLKIPVVHVWTTIHKNDDIRMPHWKYLNKWICIEGTEGHDTPESLKPLESEKIVHKIFYSAFEDGKLDEILNSTETDTIWVAGVHLHGCLRATILDAYQRGLGIWVADDAVASDDPLHATITRRYLEKRAVKFVTVDYLLSLIVPENHESLQDMDSYQSLPSMIIANREVYNETLENFIHISPRQNNDRLWKVPVCGDEQVSQATIEAQSAWLHWRDSDIKTRVEILERLAELLKKESQTLVKQMAIEVGKPVMFGQHEVLRCIELLHSVAHHANDVLQGHCGTESVFRYRPLGVVSIVSPWNNPLAIPLGKIAPALLYGNTVVWKPALAASSIAIRIMNLLHLAGCHPGTVNLVCGDNSTAEALMSDECVDAVTITGTLAAGYSAQVICTRRHIPLQAELGGNNASIVWSDCDLEETSLKVAEAAFGLAGQRCTANRRVIVERQCYHNFMKFLEKAVSALIWGDPINHRTQVGPLISSSKRNQVATVVLRAKATAETILIPHEANPHYKELTRTGVYYPPTVICCNDYQHEIVQEETFGPVLVVQKAYNWDHAIKLCNGVKQGLVAGLFSQSKKIQAKFLDDAQAGILKINSATAGVGVESPFGGWKASGIGPPEHGTCDREFYTRTQSIYL